MRHHHAHGRPAGNDWQPYVLLLVVRLFVCFTVRAPGAPDEWWQSTEVAYYLVFGRGQLTWEWTRGIRSVAFPCLYALPFWVLRVTGLDNATTIYTALKTVQVLTLFAIDCVVLHLARLLDADMDSGDSAASEISAASRQPLWKWMWSPANVVQAATVLSATSFGYNMEGIRCYSNVAETLCVMLAFAQTGYTRFLLCAGLACTLRVTAAIPLLFLFALHAAQLVRRRGVGAGLWIVLTRATLLVPAFVVGMMLVDYLFYHRWLLTAFNFLYDNVFLSVSAFYGTHPFHWYVSTAFPLLVGPPLALGLFLPFALPHNRKLHSRLMVTSGLVLWTLLVNSPLAHKEVRFVLPVLPLTLLVLAYTLVRCQNQKRRRLGPFCVPRMVRWVYRFTVAISLGMIFFFLYWYRCGPSAATSAVRRSAAHFNKLDVFTGCYLTPGLSHMHGKVDVLRLVDCDMVIDPVTHLPSPTEQSLYLLDPVAFFNWRYFRRRVPLAGQHAADIDELPVKDQLNQEEFWSVAERLLPASEPAEPLPDAFIFFANVAEQLQESVLTPQGYKRIGHYFHAYKSLEPAEDGFMDLWARGVT